MQNTPLEFRNRDHGQIDVVTILVIVVVVLLIIFLVNRV